MSELNNAAVREEQAQPSSLAKAGQALAVAGLAAKTLLRPQAAQAVSPPLTFAQIPGTGDVKVLNFALSLEVFESELYAQALLRFTRGGVSPLGTRVTGLNSSNGRVIGFVREFGQAENQHRDFLEATLGSQAITNSLLKGATFNFNINSMDEKSLTLFLFDVESTGVAAYLGGIPFFSTKQFIPAAASIQGVEARHTAIFADIVRDMYVPTVDVAPPPSFNNARDPYVASNGAGQIPNTPPGTPPNPNNVLLKVSPFFVLANGTTTTG